MNSEIASLPFLVKVQDAAKFLNVSRATIWNRMNDGTLSSVRIGTSRRIHRDSLLRIAGVDPAADNGKAA